MRYITISLFIILFCWITPADPAMLFDPDLTWSSIRTKHFWIHYHQGLEPVAQKIAGIAEKVHTRLSREFRWEPFLRTDVVLVDNMDLANGFSGPFPYNRIQLYISRAELDSVLSNYDDWLELVFIHEYTHTLNMDTIHGIPSLSRYTCGRVCFPNACLPVWMLEGSAVYRESSGWRYGRNNSTYVDMMMRADVISGTFKSIAEASHYPRRWPLGNVPYIYGGRFVEYLERKYGYNRISSVFEENADNVLPYLVNYNAECVYGRSFLSLWREWEQYVKNKHLRFGEKIRESGITEYTRLTVSGQNTTIPRFSHDGKNIFFIRYTNYNEPVLAACNLETKSIREICGINYPGDVSVTGDGTVYISDIEFYRSFSLYGDMFIVKNGRRSQLTSGLRCRNADVSSVHNKAVFVKSERDRYSLVLGDSGFSSFNTIISGTDILLAFPKLSPDGKKAAFVMRDRKGRTDIALHDFITGKNVRITSDDFNDIHPVWHPGGEKIIFSSDRNGVYNLHELDLKANTVTRITNLIGGAFFPDISPDSAQIAFADYSSTGFDIAVTGYPLRRYESSVVVPSELGEDYFMPGPSDTRPGESRLPHSGYTVWNSVLPPAWIPFTGSEEMYEDEYDTYLGFYTMGADTLFQHLYMIGTYMHLKQKRATVQCIYMLARFYPDLILNYSDNTLFWGDDEFPWEDENRYSIKRTLTRKGSVAFNVPFIYFRSQHLLFLSYNYEKKDIDIYYPGYEIIEYSNIFAWMRGVYYYSNAQVYPYSVSSEDGRSLYIIGDYYSDRIGSDLSYYKFRGEFAEYLPGIWRNNVIMARVRGGVSFDNPDYLAPFTLGRFEKGTTGGAADDEDEFGLRGYPSGLMYGNRLAAGAVEYRLPVLQADIGYGTIPVMIRDIWITGFYEYGNVWMDETQFSDFKSSAGVELHVRITLGYFVDLQGYIGYAHGFDEYGENQVYFAVGTFYEGAFKNRNKWFDFL